MIKIDFKTKIGRIILYVAAGIIFLVLARIALRETADEIVYKGKMKQAVQREKIKEFREKEEGLQKEKGNLILEISVLAGKLKETTAPGKIKTITIEKVEYVPKIEYVNLWNNSETQKNIISKYFMFTIKDLQLQMLSSEKEKEYELQIQGLQKTIARLHAVSKRKWHICVGPVVGISTKGWFAGVGVGLMYEIK